MTLKKYLITMTLATMVCWGIFLTIISAIDPSLTNWIGFSFSYLSLFLSLWGTSAVLGFFVRFVILHQNLAFRAVGDAFRQSFFFSTLIVLSLVLISHNLLTWLNLALLILILSFIELFLLGTVSKSNFK